MWGQAGRSRSQCAMGTGKWKDFPGGLSPVLPRGGVILGTDHLKAGLLFSFAQNEENNTSQDCCRIYRY